MTDHAAVFEEHRRFLFSLAYRMLGSAVEAEDVVQETWLRFAAVPLGEILTARAFLTTIATRLSVNHLQSARTRRETYVGSWLPEPILTENAAGSDPATAAELQESVSLAFLTLLEQLSAAERAVFLLREVFSYGYADIAAMLEKDEAACRQLLSRAKKQVAAGRPRFRVDAAEHRRLLERFVAAVETGDLSGLTRLLADDAVLWADGAGRVRGAIRRPVAGKDAVASFVLSTVNFRPAGYSYHFDYVNGEPSLILTAEGRVFAVVALALIDGRIAELRVVGSPEKLSWVRTDRRSAL